MKYAVGIALVLLTLAQQTSGWWESLWWPRANLLGGFVPGTLAYHAGVSILAGICWLMAVRYCWPADLDDIGRGDADGAA